MGATDILESIIDIIGLAFRWVFFPIARLILHLRSVWGDTPVTGSVWGVHEKKGKRFFKTIEVISEFVYLIGFIIFAIFLTGFLWQWYTS